MDIEIHNFEIIYKLSEWLESAIKERTPKIETKEVTGSAKILKIFSQNKDKQVLGGKVQQGKIVAPGTIAISRRGNEIGKGKILNLQAQKADTKEVAEGNEFGAQIESKIEIVPGDVVENFIVTLK